MPSVTSSPPRSGRTRVFLTGGDPAGIGPEVLLAAWNRTAAHATASLRACVCPAHLTALPDRPGSTSPPAIETVSVDDPRPSSPGTVLVIDPGATSEVVPIGIESAAGGRAAVAALSTALLAARRAEDAGCPAALVTGPLHKGALHAAGHDVPGHTEWLARACGRSDADASMMLWLPPDPPSRAHGLGVVHATLHESLTRAVGRISMEGIVAAGLRLDSLLVALLGRRPRVAVAALNPHGGEGGLFGDEEARIIAPAVEALVTAGVDATGPLPADTLFLRAAGGAFDGVVAQYHDQGHIPVKLLGMHRAVNITLGLPLLRTSVAHGTAFDIVGSGKADPSSMVAAIDAAVRLAGVGWRGDTIRAHGRSGNTCGM